MTYDSFDDISPIHLHDFSDAILDYVASLERTTRNLWFGQGVAAYIAFLGGYRDDSTADLIGSHPSAWRSGWYYAECEARDYLDALAEEVA